MLNLRSKKAFTIIELLITVAIILILFSATGLGLSSAVPKTNLNASVQSLISDLRSQQTKAMSGYTNGVGDGSAYGIFFEESQYTLFSGASYDLLATDNFTVQLDSTLQLVNIGFPGSSLVFAQNTGEVLNYAAGSDSLTLRNTAINQDEVLIVNKFGIDY